MMFFVYMEQLEGFILPGNENKVYRLVKSLYGLKQTPIQWYKNFILRFYLTVLSIILLANAYSKFANCIGVVISLNVDDLFNFCTNIQGLSKTKKYLTSGFEMKSLNEVDIILGIKFQNF